MQIAPPPLKKKRVLDYIKKKEKEGKLKERKRESVTNFRREQEILSIF